MSQPPVTTLDVRSAMEGAGALVRRSRPGEGVPEPFGHQFQSSAALLLVVERGELTVRVQRQEVALRAPGALLVRSGVTVSGWDGRSSDYWMVLIEAGLAEHIGTVEGLPMEVARNFDAFRDVMADLDEPLGLGNATAERLGFLLRELALELEDRDSGFRMATRSLLALMLVQLRRQQQLQMSREFSQDHILFSEVLDYIDRHFDRPLEMGEIADAVGRSPAHLTTLLRRSTGKTLLGWVTDRRMAEARRLLVETSVPVAEIATRVGYGSPSYFTRVFGRHVGESPARFRSRNRRRVRCRGRTHRGERMASRLSVGVRYRTVVLPLAALLLPLLLWGCGDGDDEPMPTGQTGQTDPADTEDGVSSTRSGTGSSTEGALATPCASRGRSICTPAGDAVLRCDEDGRTTVRALCEAGCRNGACVTACSIDGTLFCRDGDRWRCRAGRSPERIGPCPAGTVCTAGECLPRACTPDTVSCRNRDEGLACDGSGYREIPFDCGIGLRCEDGLCLEGGRNACGGSAALPARPGTVCGPCGLDTWRCDGPDAMRCDGETENGCGGCRFFSQAIGDLCGQCGTWQCDPADPDRPVCSDPGFNACGTCGPLDGVPGASCGPCGRDALICRDGALTCNGETTNACGGCSTLPDLLGEACGTCGTGAYVCDGEDFLRCAEVPSCTARLLASGRDHLCIVRADDGLVCWGANGDGQLGVGSIATWRPPQPVSSSVGPVRTVALGDRHSCAIRTNNTLRCWGANTRGQLGDGSTSTRLQPASEAVLTAVAEVALGDGFTCARLLNGRVRCWGANERGQLGDGGEDDRTTPGSGSILDQVDALVAGARHACALRDGEVRCWGDGARGRLGHGETSPARTPVSVSLPREAVAIAAGEEHTCALLEGGEVHCWGANTFGQLGASGEDALVPGPVGGLSGVRSLAAGAQHTCAVTSDAVFCFGANDGGQLGVSGVASTSTPTAVPGLSGAFEIVAGAEHSCGLRNDGTLTCWGSNRRGQRGKAPEPGPFAPSPLRF